MGQEPLGENEIKEFIKDYNVTYDMGSKIKVNGCNTHPIYSFMKKEKRGCLCTTSIKWNFTKFLIDKQGQVIKRYAPTSKPAVSL